jgi:hypothetical protein
MFKGTVNLCKSTIGSLGDLIFRNVFENFKHSSNLSLTCPIQAGYYYASNIPAMDVNDFPRQFQAFDVQWEIIETIKAKFSGTRSLVQLVEIKFYGNLVKAENSFAFG